jgi:hypothetical protein
MNPEQRAAFDAILHSVEGKLHREGVFPRWRWRNRQDICL